jgi:hypothetical protein
MLDHNKISLWARVLEHKLVQCLLHRYGFLAKILFHLEIRPERGDIPPALLIVCISIPLHKMKKKFLHIIPIFEWGIDNLGGLIKVVLFDDGKHPQIRIYAYHFSILLFPD